MFHQRETNPHFQPKPSHQSQPLQPQDGSNLHIPALTHTRNPRSRQPPSQSRPPRPEAGPDNLHIPPLTHPPFPEARQTPSQPQPRDGSPKLHIPPLVRPPLQRSRPPTSQSPSPRLQPHPHSRPSPPPFSNHQEDSHLHPSSLLFPPPKKTKGFTWLVAIFCVLFWIIVILGGLVLLIVYLAYRPRLPKFDISSVSLNAAYLDLGYLLNADMTVLANFTNPNKKVNVEFTNAVIDLYFEDTLIATHYIRPLSVANRNYKLTNIHMVTSQVAFSRSRSQDFRRQVESGRLMFHIKGFFRTTSRLGGFLKYSYWLHGHCSFAVSGPPSGVMLAKKCVSKR